jgi:hypothetical protein
LIKKEKSKGVKDTKVVKRAAKNDLFKIEELNKDLKEL